MMKRQLFHEQIADTLRKEILATAEVGQKLASDAEHAQRFGVSVITLREAMRMLCQEGILERRQGSGTRVVSVTPPAKRVALLAPPHLAAPPYYFHHRLLQVAAQRLKALGFETETIPEDPASNDEDTLLRLLARDRDKAVDAVLRIQGPRDPEAVFAVEEAGIPVVGQDENIYTCSVHPDHESMILEATRFLIEQGRRRIAFVQYEQPALLEKGEEWFLLVQFKEALAEAGIAYRPEWVCTAHDPFKPGSGWDHIHDLWLGSGEKPDALLIGVDTLFTETAMALLTLGVRVPDDVLVVTHANKGSGMFCPFPVIKLEVDPEACANAMVDVLIQRLQGDQNIPRETLIPFEWIGLPTNQAINPNQKSGAGGPRRT